MNVVAASGTQYAIYFLFVGVTLLIIAFGGFGPFTDEKEENKDEE